MRSVWSFFDGGCLSDFTFDRLLETLDLAFTEPAAEYDSAWDAVTAQAEYLSDELEVIRPASEDAAFHRFAQTLHFQVADLRRMESAGLLDERHIYVLGVKSPRDGDTWYNFDPCTYLSCGGSALLTFDEHEAAVLGRWPWLTMDALLLNGRDYE